MAKMDKDLMRHANVPRDAVFTNRIFVGLYSVLASLRATADWAAALEEDRTGVPTTELGKIEAAFFALKA
jgi:hypothetical protein